jgi:hypothetical protein
MFAFLRRTSLYLLAIPVLLTVLGATSNQVVLMANHDRFPVLANETKVQKVIGTHDVQVGPNVITVPNPAVTESDGTVMIDDTHCVMSSKTHLNFLADVFDLGSIYSIGDFSLILGSYLWVYAPMLFLFDATRKLTGMITK